MSALAAHDPSDRAARSLRTVLRAAGFVGLALMVIAVGVSNVLAPAPAGLTHAGPLLAAPSLGFPFGTDSLGRDIFSETVHGLGLTLTGAMFAAAVSLAAGSALGFISARLSGVTGTGLRWSVGMVGAVPPLLLAILLIGLAGPAFAPAAAGLAAAPFAFARAYDRGAVLAASRHAEFARAAGVAVATLMRRDLTYEFGDLFVADAARALAAAAITLSTASFLGFGAHLPHRDLGAIIAAAFPHYLGAWWVAGFPAAALTLLVLFARLAATLDEARLP